MVEYGGNKKKPIYKKKWFIAFCIVISIPIIIFEIACISVAPSILILEIILALSIVILAKAIKKEKSQKKIKLQKERGMIQQGYKKICESFYINNKENKLKILDNVYGFSQIIDCELIEDYTSYQTTQLEICTELGVNITTNDFNNPRIMFDCKCKKNVAKNSKAYKDALNNAQNIISTLKIVISQNNEKYIETGTITKIEHKYITEENASIQIERLSQLHKDGVLTDYEFEMKKKELLDKIK